jgi:hypothetical protein
MAKYIFRLAQTAKVDFYRMRDSLPGDKAARSTTAKLQWSEFCKGFEECGGLPPGAVPDPRYRPTCYWCAFPGPWLALVRLKRKRGLFRTTYHIAVVEITEFPRDEVSNSI